MSDVLSDIFCTFVIVIMDNESLVVCQNQFVPDRSVYVLITLRESAYLPKIKNQHVLNALAFVVVDE